MPARSDVQTNAHFVPVDSDSPIRNLLKVQTVICVSVDREFGAVEGRFEALLPL